ncbi:malignant fibrous histiocytoma-amplified sequence 1 homolog [Lingula anatina]|uniref:Malignant fibrous histiocytoma-amplified sequence 1 homolog n=1 Tax=Lingula anatina TaxID=7574 RepID=A0A1S3KGX2_LINAN|nr:malignant fibrous histiocytoma-amplified sequence 1 homolog [Lingula anatina]|eukprot:XP_013421888.1 malignant fibrous histiocytoma-amplified sequence 1 homolog [Lingula anatina]
MEAQIGRVKKYCHDFSHRGASLTDAAFQTQFTELKALLLSLSTLYTRDDYDKLLTDPLHAADKEKNNKRHVCSVMGDNQLSDIPVDISRLKTLKIFHLNSYAFTTLPTTLCGLTNIEVLYLGDNQLSDIPVDISKLKALIIFRLNKYACTSFPIALCGLTNVEVLNLSGNQLSDVPVDITRLTNLESLDLHHNNISHLPPQFKNMENHNPLVQPPIEIANRGLGAIKRYFEALTDTKAIHSSRLQVNFLGETDAGKISISRTLQFEQSTLTKMADRIGVVEQGIWEAAFNISDFGGHDVFKMFISTSGLVFITFNLSEYDPKNEAHYQLNIPNWIDKVQEQMPRIQIALIGTHLDEVETLHAERKCSSITRQLEDHVSKKKKWYQAQKETSEKKIKEISEAQVFICQVYQKKAAHLQSLYGQMKPIYEHLISFARTSAEVLPGMYAAKKICTKKIEGTENTLGWEVIEDLILQNMPKLSQGKNEKIICDISSFLAHHGDKIWFDNSLSLMKVVFHKKEVIVNVLKAVLIHDQVEVSQMLQKSMKITRKKATRMEEDIFSRGIISKQAKDCLWQPFSLSSTNVEAMIEMMQKLELCYQAHKDESILSSFHFPWLLTEERQPETNAKWSSKILPDTTQLTQQVLFPYRCPDGLYEKFSVCLYKHLGFMKTMQMDWKDGELERYKMQLTRGPHQSNSDTVSQDPDWVISIAAHGSHLSDMWGVLKQGHSVLMDITKKDWPGPSYDKYLECPHCVSEDSRDPTLFPGEILDQSHGMTFKARQTPWFNTGVYFPADMFYPPSWQEGKLITFLAQPQ